MNPTDKNQGDLDSLRSTVDAHDDVKTFLANSASWADTQAEQSEKSKRTAWRVTAGMGALTALSLAATITTIVLSHRPAPPPQVLIADKSTGAVERLVSFQTSKKPRTKRPSSAASRHSCGRGKATPTTRLSRTIGMRPHSCRPSFRRSGRPSGIPATRNRLSTSTSAIRR